MTYATLHRYNIYMTNNKRNKFEALINTRVNKAIKILRLISNLANKSHYSYTQDDAEKIISTLNQEIRNIKDKFYSKNSRDSKEFKL